MIHMCVCGPLSMPVRHLVRGAAGVCSLRCKCVQWLPHSYKVVAADCFWDTWLVGMEFVAETIGIAGASSFASRVALVLGHMGVQFGLAIGASSCVRAHRHAFGCLVPLAAETVAMIALQSGLHSACFVVHVVVGSPLAAETAVLGVLRDRERRAHKGLECGF